MLSEFPVLLFLSADAGDPSELGKMALLPLGIFAADLAVLLTAVWKISSSVTKIITRLEQVEKRIGQMDRR
jgi:hypothetical protein